MAQFYTGIWPHFPPGLTHDTVTPSWELSAPEELFDIFMTATVGAAMLIKNQKPEVIDAIGDQITSTVANKFAKGSGFQVPVPVAVVTATPA